MAQQPDIQSILAALAQQQQQPVATPTQTPPVGQGGPPGIPGYPGPIPNSTTPSAYSTFPLPQPSNAGSLDLSSIKPVNSGSVSIQDALAKARSIAASKGIAFDPHRAPDPRDGSHAYLHSRSRSRSPRHDNYREGYNAYRDDRRGGHYGRDRSQSPARGGRNGYSPQAGGRGHRDRTPPREDGNSEVIEIESGLVGLVIGRQGENLRRIEQESGTRIQFITPPSHGGPQRECRITGNPRARMDAKREIYRIIDENGGSAPRELNRGGTTNRQPAKNANHGQGQGQGQSQSQSQQPALRDGENNMQIMVPDRTVGLIIGRGGETIRDLQERSGCHINIVGVNKSVNGLRPVNLIGSPEAANRAKDLILEIVESDTRGPDGATPQQQQQQQQQQPSAAPHAGGNQAGPDKINETIMVPSDAVGMIIGKGGETIRDMQNTTGCKINVTQPTGADTQREIGLVGSRQALEAAKAAIWEKVEAVRQKQGGHHGPGRDSRRDNAGSQYSQQQYGQQQTDQQYPTQQNSAPAAPNADANAADPYAAWGGYQNYVNLWIAQSIAQQQTQGQQPPQS